MALIIEDRVMETSTSSGTGAFTLAGAYTAYKTFASVCAVNDTVYYMIEAIDANGVATGDWESGLGTYSSANTLTRTTVHNSSAADAAVNFVAGTKRVGMILSSTHIASLASGRPISFFFTSTPTASEVLLLYTAAEAITLADDFVGSIGDVGTNPTASFALDVQKNGVSVGTITISTGGVFTFVTAATTVALAIGDQLKIVAPAGADATVANVSITLKGTL